MVFFLKKKAPAQEGGAEYVPTEIVERLSSQGRSEPEIVTQLRSQGFSPTQIEAAIRDALKREVTSPRPAQRGYPTGPTLPGTARRPEMTGAPGMGEVPPRRPAAGPVLMGEELPTSPMQPQAPPERFAPAPEPEPAEQPAAPIVTIPSKPPIGHPPERIVAMEQRPLELSAPPGLQGESVPTFARRPEEVAQPYEVPPSEITLEELIEGVVAERWETFEDRLGNFEKRDVQLQQQIGDLRKELSNVRNAMKEREQNLVGKLDDFGESMTGIQGRIGGIESAFKEFVPAMTENVRAMSGLVEKFKKE
jgi:hypothetical protein